MDLLIAILRVLGFAVLAAGALVAFFSIFFGVPGQVAIACLIGIVAWATGWERIGFVPVVVMLGISLSLEGVDYVAGFLGARRGGGTFVTGVFALLGSLVGASMALAAPLPLLNILFGSFLGSFAGAFGYEYYRTRRAGFSARVGLFTIWSRIFATFLKAGVACGMVAFSLWRLVSG